LCDDSQKHTYANTQRHKKSVFHQTLVEEAARCEETARCEDEGERESESEQRTAATFPPFLALVDNATRNLLTSLAGSSSPAASNGASGHEHTPEPAPIEGWGLFGANEDTELAMSLEQQGVALITQSLLERFDELSVGSAEDADADERSQVDEHEVLEPTVAGKSLSSFIL
jgi:hypothetical protein